ncbi:unnamed protein product, partial [Coregonus sp. 'balchen']
IGLAPTSQEREEQLTVFNKQLQIYKEMDLPVNIHSQSAAKVTIATLKEQAVSAGINRNEPKNILLVCEYIAQVKGITPQMVIHATTENALRLFLEIRSLKSHTSH